MPPPVFFSLCFLGWLVLRVPAFLGRHAPPPLASSTLRGHYVQRSHQTSYRHRYRGAAIIPCASVASPVENKPASGDDQEDNNGLQVVEVITGAPSLHDPLSSLLIEAGAVGVHYDRSTSSSTMIVYFPRTASFDAAHIDRVLTWAVNEISGTTTERHADRIRWEDAGVIEPGDEWYRVTQGEDAFPVLDAGLFQVVPVNLYVPPPPLPQHQLIIRPGAGWGTGQHPTTRLCLEFLSQEGVIAGGERVIDYGCGSGILAIGATKLGAMECLGVDVDVEALQAARVNCKLNGVDDDVIELLHASQISPGNQPPADVMLANILIGPLLALAPTIASLTRPGGYICISGIRPEQVDAIKTRYDPFVEWDEQLTKKEETPGTTWGWWSRVVGRRRLALDGSFVENLSAAAVEW